MNAKADIPIRIVGDQAAPQSVGIGGGLKAILHEILAMLENLAAYGESGQIDLRGLPLAPGEYGRLKAKLGKGEAEIKLHIGGLTHCWETAYPGIWWIQHHDASGSKTAEFIEVAKVPEILLRETEDLRRGISWLEQELDGDRANRGVA